MPNSNPSPHFDPETLTRFQEELARATALPDLASAGPVLWPRFAGYYERLARLPRKARRALQRRWRRSLGGLALLCALGQAPALAATINVGGACTLVDAITAANNDAPTGFCTAGSGADTLVLSVGSTHTLTAVNNSTYGPTGLPLVTSGITIAGNGGTITRDPSAPPFRILAVAANGNLMLQETTVSGGAPGVGGGGGVYNDGSMTLTGSTVSGNSATFGGGVFNGGNLTLTNSTVSGNSAGSGGGVDNGGSLTVTNSTMSGNSAGSGGGARNSGTLTLVQTLVSGNTASTQGPELDSSGLVNANNFNLFGHDTIAGVVGFTPGPTDLVPNTPLAAILNPTLGDNGALTRTHALVAGSPAADAVPAASCATASDQRGVLRPQDSDLDTVADCDIGAFELRLPAVEAAPADPGSEIHCTLSRCAIPITCNVEPASGTLCINRIELFVRADVVRLNEPSSTDAPRQIELIRFAAVIANIAPGETAEVSLRLTREGRQIVRTSKQETLPGAIMIRNTAGTSVSETPIRVRLRDAVEAAPADPNPQAQCTRSTCGIRIQCNINPAIGTQCTNRIRFFVRESDVRRSERASTKAPRRIRFAAGIANVPSGETAEVALRLTKQGKRIVRTTKRKSLRGVIEIRNTPGTNFSSRRIRIRLTRPGRQYW